ncbi:MAG: Gmad2 immunoglobulin-like domain-containing protein [Patescibacteria group bacterium]
MNSLKIIIPAVILFILATAGVYTIYQTQTANKKTVDATPQISPQSNFPTSSASPKLQPSPTSASQTNVQAQPATGTDELEIKNEGIQLQSPTRGELVNSPLTVSGIANVTSQIVVITVKDTAGNTLGQGTAQACVGLDACYFETTIAFSGPRTSIGYLEVYSPSTIDNSPTFLQTIPVSF